MRDNRDIVIRVANHETGLADHELIVRVDGVTPGSITTDRTGTGGPNITRYTVRIGDITLEARWNDDDRHRLTATIRLTSLIHLPPPSRPVVT